MDKRTFERQVIQYCTTGPNPGLGHLFIGAWSGGCGVVVVKDSKGEFDIYFDPYHWELSMPQAWPEESLRPPGLKDYDLCVMETVGQLPKIRSAQQAIDFAGRMLKPKQGEKLRALIELDPSGA